MKKIFLIAILSMVLINCSNDDNSPNNSQETNELTGTWRLTSFIQGFSTPYHYEQEEIVWEFNENGTITITVSDEAEVNPDMPFQNSGSYDYALEEDNQMVYISSNSQDFGHTYTLLSNNNVLILNWGDVTADGGYTFSFEKVE